MEATMDNGNEWLYGKLLEHLKQKEREKEEALYKQLELELPLIIPEHIGDEKVKEEEDGYRGVIIIQF